MPARMSTLKKILLSPKKGSTGYQKFSKTSFAALTASAASTSRPSSTRRRSDELYRLDDRLFTRDQIVDQHDQRNHRQQMDDSSGDVQNESQQPQNQKDRNDCSKHGFRIVLSSSALFRQALKPSELIRE